MEFRCTSLVYKGRLGSPSGSADCPEISNIENTKNLNLFILLYFRECVLEIVNFGLYFYMASYKQTKIELLIPMGTIPNVFLLWLKNKEPHIYLENYKFTNI